MGLVLNFTTGSTNSPNEVNLFDTTGENPNPITGYNNTVNPPNAGSGVLSSATLTILPYLSQSTPSVVNVKSNTVPFPNTDGIPFVLLNTDFGLTSNAPIASGIYQMTYTQIFVTGNYSTTKYVYLDYQHQCCSDKILAKATSLGCADKGQLQTLAINIQAMINRVHSLLASNCDAPEDANDVVKLISAICVDNGCNGNQ